MIDEAYSVTLILHSEPELPSTKQLTQTIDVVQVFRAPDEVIGLSRLRSQEPLYETRRRSDIDALFDAIRSQKGAVCDWRRDTVYHLIAYDRTLMRVAYIRVYRCKDRGRVAVRAGDIGPFVSDSLSQFLDARVQEH